VGKFKHFPHSIWDDMRVLISGRTVRMFPDTDEPSEMTAVTR